MLVACNAVIENERLAMHVKCLWFDQSNDRQRPVDLGREFWTVVQRALIAMCNIEVLFLCDRSFSNGWVLDNPAIQFNLKEAKLWSVWNAPLTRFLERQTSLQTLHFVDALEDITHRITPGALPDLRIFDGAFMVALQLLSCPLHHLQVTIDSDPKQLPLQRLGSFRKTLRSLNLLDVPEEWSSRFLKIVCATLPDLKHIGIFSYPMLSVSLLQIYLRNAYVASQRHDFFQNLMGMHNLKSIELDVTKWQPSPVVPGGQRALASELQTYCPSIQLVTFWLENSRVRWSYTHNSGLWHHRSDSPVYPQYSNTWYHF
jgi:hypothetical protein